ncbi:MAG: hypothetical protein FWF25_08050 [Propionibacteriaceae bacterium]|nr:hypothetical protein [Propionibacteriaceae bacterium]
MAAPADVAPPGVVSPGRPVGRYAGKDTGETTVGVWLDAGITIEVDSSVGMSSGGMPGRESAGKEKSGSDSTGSDGSGSDGSGSDSAGPERSGSDNTRRDGSRPDGAGADIAASDVDTWKGATPGAAVGATVCSRAPRGVDVLAGGDATVTGSVGAA